MIIISKTDTFDEQPIKGPKAQRSEKRPVSSITARLIETQVVIIVSSPRSHHVEIQCCGAWCTARTETRTCIPSIQYDGDSSSCFPFFAYDHLRYGRAGPFEQPPHFFLKNYRLLLFTVAPIVMPIVSPWMVLRRLFLPKWRKQTIRWNSRTLKKSWTASTKSPLGYSLAPKVADRANPWRKKWNKSIPPLVMNCYCSTSTLTNGHRWLPNWMWPWHLLCCSFNEESLHCARKERYQRRRFCKSWRAYFENDQRWMTGWLAGWLTRGERTSDGARRSRQYAAMKCCIAFPLLLILVLLKQIRCRWYNKNQQLRWAFYCSIEFN